MANHYITSNGERVTQTQINSRLARAKHGSIRNYICECFGMPFHAHDLDHTISQQRSKQIHKTELIWDENNWSWSSREAHMQWESFKSGQFQDHLNFKKRMEFVAKHDPVGFNMRCNYLTYPDLIEWASDLSKIPT